MMRLRGPGGCPWDHEQTHASLCETLIEEAAELLEAIDKEDLEHMREELGDVLLQVVFHAQIASENGHFNFDDVAREINDKLVRRHPHVFGDLNLADSDAVLVNWEKIKAEERKNKPPQTTRLKPLPPRLPALLFARDTYKQIVKLRISEDLPNASLDSECGENGMTESGLGKALFDLAAQAQKSGIDPESALRRYTQSLINHIENG